MLTRRKINIKKITSTGKVLGGMAAIACDITAGTVIIGKYP
jgi:hypothetical protein